MEMSVAELVPVGSLYSQWRSSEWGQRWGEIIILREASEMGQITSTVKVGFFSPTTKSLIEAGFPNKPEWGKLF